MSIFFLYAAVGFLAGNLLVQYPPDRIWPVGLLCLAGSITWCGWSRTATIFKLVILIVCAAAGYLAARQTVERYDALPLPIQFDGPVLVLEKDIAKTWYQPLILQPQDGTDGMAILFQAARTLEAVPGDRLHLQCALIRPKNFSERFDYRRFLEVRGIGYLCERGTVNGLQSEASWWRARLFAWQSWIEEHIHRFLPEPAAGLMQGLLLGGDDMLASSVSTDFRRAGLSHIVAVSGYNMTLVATMILFLALFMGLWRRSAVIFATLGIACFLLTIDITSASLRAALMSWVIALAYLLGRPTQALTSLCLAASVMALFNPLMVRYDIGFQLSFMATLALITAMPWMEVWLRRCPVYWRWIMLPMTTLIISLFIDPILAFHFGTVTLMSPLANTLVLPLVPLSMLLGFGLLLASSLLPIIAPLFAWPTWIILESILKIAHLLAVPHWGVQENMFPSEPFLWAWALALWGAIWYSRKSFHAYALRMDNPARTD